MSEKCLKFLHDRYMFFGIKSCNLDLCEHCIFGKHKRVWFTTSSRRSFDLFQLIHSDIFGPIPTLSINGARYFLTYIDEYSRRVMVYFLKNKSKAFEKFKMLKEQVTKSLGKYILYLIFDNGVEYCSKEFNTFVHKK